MEPNDTLAAFLLALINKNESKALEHLSQLEKQITENKKFSVYRVIRRLSEDDLNDHEHI